MMATISEKDEFLAAFGRALARQRRRFNEQLAQTLVQTVENRPLNLYEYRTKRDKSSGIYVAQRWEDLEEDGEGGA